MKRGKRKKLVHITQSMNRGGAEKLILDLVLQCKKHYDITIICQYDRIDPDFKRILLENDIKLVFLNKKPGLSIKAFRDLNRVLDEIKPDIVHTHMHSAVYALSWYWGKKNVKKVHTVHSVPRKEFTFAHRMIQYFAYHFFGVVPVAIGNEVYLQMKRIYHINKEKIKLIYNGVDTERFACPVRGFDEKRKFTIVNVANFSIWKNQKMLVDVMNNLREDYHLVLVGDGACREVVEDKAERLEVTDRITFVGSVDDVSPYLKEADVFVMSSNFEGIPLSIIEAFAASLPVVATNVGGIPDLVQDGINGFLVPLDDYVKMAEKIIELHEDKSIYEKIAKNNQKKSRLYDIRYVAAEYENLYEE